MSDTAQICDQLCCMDTVICRWIGSYETPIREDFQTIKTLCAFDTRIRYAIHLVDTSICNVDDRNAFAT